MKVLLNSPLSISQKRNQNTQKESNQNVSVPVQTGRTFELPGYNQINTNFKKYNTSLSFGNKAGKKIITEANVKLLKELDNLKKEKESLLVQSANAAVEAAKKRIGMVDNWDNDATYAAARDVAVKAGNKAQNDYVGDHGTIWRWLNGDGTSEYYSAYSNKMEEHYYKYKREIDKYEENIETDKEIVRLAKANAEEKAKRLKDIESNIEKIKKLISFQSLQDVINDMLSAKGGVLDRIAGYDKVKDEIKVKFVDKLAKSKDDPKTEVPGCVILYGPTGTGKTTFLQGIADQSKDVAEVVNVSRMQDSTNFFSILNKFLDEAKTRYIKEQKRTILLMDDAEQILSIDKQEAPKLGIELDESDISKLDAYGNNSKKIAKFKSLLDEIAKVPEGGANINDSNKSAATFFITTNYPHLIHPDILTRSGKATKIAVGLASDFDLGEVVRFYFEKMNNVADTIKALKHNPDYKEAIDGIAGISDKGKANIKKMIEDGTIDRLHVDHDKIPYNKVAKSLNPNETEGAYSNDCIREISQNAFIDYLEKNPVEDDYRDSFFKVLINTKRDINPARLEKFTSIEKMIQEVEIDPDTLEQLLHQKEMGMLSDKSSNLLKYRVELIKAELKGLKEIESKENLSGEMIQRKQLLEELQLKIDEAENNNIV